MSNISFSCSYVNNIKLEEAKENIYNLQSYTVIDIKSDKRKTFTLNGMLEQVITLFPNNIIITK